MIDKIFNSLEKDENGEVDAKAALDLYFEEIGAKVESSFQFKTCSCGSCFYTHNGSDKCPDCK